MRKIDICVCGHSLQDHNDLCPKCRHGECMVKLRKGNNNDFCECQEYSPKTLPQRKRASK